MTVREYDLGKTLPNTKLDRKYSCEFTTLRSYEFQGRIFAVSGQCVVFSLSVSRNKHLTITSKNYMAAITQYTFYDKDGDGKFETRYNSDYSSRPL